MKNNLKTIRFLRGYKSPKQFAGLIDESTQNLHNMEVKFTAIKPDKAQKICEILNCNLDDLYDEHLDFENLKDKEESFQIINIKFFKNLFNNKYNNKEDFKQFINNIVNYEKHQYDKKIFRTLGKVNINEGNLISFLMIGNYMCKYIYNGNYIIVDPENMSFSDNQIYLVNENGELKIRRITQPNPDEDNYKVFTDKEDDIDFKQYHKIFEELKKIIYGKIIEIIK